MANNDTKKAVDMEALSEFKGQMNAVVDSKIQDAELNGAGIEWATREDILALFNGGSTPSGEPGQPTE